ncbi:hypothetical protein [Thiomicrorhabdus heinhorstiae]|uniref:Periplasmic heavy metal sensor n=1 Tax=Thiomicrorhabdus heinhorstiae TaxID=2748010 RepID=A0ABS0BUV1_9GAMM|nr:hypothetical protein [Thiomicrorhabdus heinhorstiae]MBF6057612.1 hypothetical protein [Thiomicrorhabdus heinhorstiae]
MTKTSKVVGILALSALSVSVWAYGDFGGPGVKAGPGPASQGCQKAGMFKGGKNMDPAAREQRFQQRMEVRLQRMTQNLQLSQDQQDAIRGIMTAQHQKMQAARLQQRAEIDKVLTPQQLEQVQQFRQARGF